MKRSQKGQAHTETESRYFDWHGRLPQSKESKCLWTHDKDGVVFLINITSVIPISEYHQYSLTIEQALPISYHSRHPQQSRDDGFQLCDVKIDWLTVKQADKIILVGGNWQ